jgi:predicted peroxiredoxin
MSKKFFVKLVTDPEIDLRKCIVGIACAAQAIKDGYDVDVFFAANGVKMLHSEFVEGVNNSGDFPDGMFNAMMKTITDDANNVWCSTGSQAANGVTKENASAKLIAGYENWLTWSGPPGVIALSAESDVQLVY